MKNTPLAGLMILAALFVWVAVMGFPASLPAAAQQDATPSPTPFPTPFPTLAPVGDLAIIAADYPRVDGSTSTLPLQQLVACKILGASCVWLEGFFGPERWIAYVVAMDEPISPELDVLNRLHHTGTHESYLNLIGGAVDLILVARAPSDDELTLAETEGVALDARPSPWTRSYSWSTRRIPSPPSAWTPFAGSTPGRSRAGPSWASTSRSATIRTTRFMRTCAIRTPAARN